MKPLRTALSLSVLICFSACQTPHHNQSPEQSAWMTDHNCYNNENYAQCSDRVAMKSWMASFCIPGESYLICKTRLNGEAIAKNPPPPPSAAELAARQAAVQAAARNAADQRYCDLQAQMAAASASNQHVLIDIYAAATGAQVRNTCLQMRAAQRAIGE